MDCKVQRSASIALMGAVMAGMVAASLAGARPVRAQSPIELKIAPPELIGGPWLNTTKKASVSLASRLGKVTILHFWTFG